MIFLTTKLARYYHSSAILLTSYCTFPFNPPLLNYTSHSHCTKATSITSFQSDWLNMKTLALQTLTARLFFASSHTRLSRAASQTDELLTSLLESHLFPQPSLPDIELCFCPPGYSLPGPVAVWGFPSTTVQSLQKVCLHNLFTAIEREVLFDLDAYEMHLASKCKYQTYTNENSNLIIKHKYRGLCYSYPDKKVKSELEKEL